MCEHCEICSHTTHLVICEIWVYVWNITLLWKRYVSKIWNVIIGVPTQILKCSQEWCTPLYCQCSREKNDYFESFSAHSRADFKNNQNRSKNPYSTLGFLRFETSKMLILERKPSKKAFFQKMIILGRETIQIQFFRKNCESSMKQYECSMKWCVPLLWTFENLGHHPNFELFSDGYTPPLLLSDRFRILDTCSYWNISDFGYVSLLWNVYDSKAPWKVSKCF